MLSVKFITGELVKDVDWNTLPNTPILYMDYKVGNKIIRLRGYERYLRLKEMAYGVNFPIQLAQTAGIRKIILIGQRGEQCDRVTLDLVTGECKKETVHISQVYNGKPIADNFWRNGKLIQEFSCRIIEE